MKQKSTTESRIEFHEKKLLELKAKLEKQNTIIIGNVEYETKTHDYNKKLSEINITKGWRLWKVSDFEKFSLEDWDKLNIKDDWFFIEQPFAYNKEKGYVARFDADSGWAVLDCGRGPSDSDSALGVRWCRDLKEEIK